MKIFALISSFACAIFFVVLSSGACNGGESTKAPVEETRQQQPPLVCSALVDQACSSEPNCKWLADSNSCDNACTKVPTADCGSTRTDCRINQNNECEDVPDAPPVTETCETTAIDKCLAAGLGCKMVDGACKDSCANVLKEDCGVAEKREDCEIKSGSCIDKESSTSETKVEENKVPPTAKESSISETKTEENKVPPTVKESSTSETKTEENKVAPTVKESSTSETETGEKKAAPTACSEIKKDDCNGAYIAHKLNCLLVRNNCKEFPDNNICKAEQRKEACVKLGCVFSAPRGTQKTCKPKCSLMDDKDRCMTVDGCTWSTGTNTCVTDKS